MLHKLPARSATSPNPTVLEPKSALHLASHRPSPGTGVPRKGSGALPDLLVIAARRCSGFFAEAAVLVLVFGILDYFMLKGRIELPWIVGALTISLGLLAASIVTDLSAHRWIKAHP